MLLNVAAHNISIQNVKVSKREPNITYSITKCTASKKLSAHYISITKRFETDYDLCAVRYVTFTFWKIYLLKLLLCVQLRLVTLRHVTFTLCCFTLCSNIRSEYYAATQATRLNRRYQAKVQLECKMLYLILFFSIEEIKFLFMEDVRGWRTKIYC